jgi:hypothetical protein
MAIREKINIYIIAADSIGLRVDSAVVASGLAAAAANTGIEIAVFEVIINIKSLNKSDNSLVLELPTKPNVIINLEQIYKLSDPRVDKALHILIPNPEWLSPITGERVSKMAFIWHKTRYSHLVIKSVYPDKKHKYIGFTSLDPGCNVIKNKEFAHFKGKSVTRNSEKILSIWYRREDLPVLKLHFFTNSLEADFFIFPEWLRWRNINVRMGKIPKENYFNEISKAGIHLCTSEVEGFGHYINESRAMGALIITTDGAPMNEMVDSNSGILIPTIANTQMSLGKRYLISEDGIEQAINQALSMKDEDIRLFCDNARTRFLKERQEYLVYLENALVSVKESI